MKASEPVVVMVNGPSGRRNPQRQGLYSALRDNLDPLHDEFQLLGFVQEGHITGPMGRPCGSVGIRVNRPIVHRFLRAAAGLLPSGDEGAAGGPGAVGRGYARAIAPRSPQAERPGPDGTAAGAARVVGRVPPAALLDLHRLATLREVERCGSYAAAAEALHFTPSAVSQQMANLARDLGLVLFERTPRGMRLTATAAMLVKHVDAAFAHLNEAQGELEAVAGGLCGRLRVGSFPTATVGFVAETVGRFQDRFPRVQLTFADGEPYESVVRLRERELDLATVFDFDHWSLSLDYDGRVVCRDREIDCAELFDDPFCVVLPRHHPLAARKRIAIAELAGERILSGPPGCSPWAADFCALCRRAGFDPELEACYCTVDFAALQAIVATGRGLTLVPELARLPVDPQIVTRPLIDGPVRHVRIATLAGVPLSAPGRAMVEMLRESSARRSSAAPALAAG